MKRILCWLLCACIAGNIFAQAGPSPSPKRTITVVFWNIQWFPGRGPNPTRGQEVRQIASVHGDLAKIDADVIGMEEVRDFVHAGVAVQPLRGFKVDVCSNFPSRADQKIPQQVAIASRLQPISAWAEFWKAGSKVSPPRGFSFAAYEKDSAGFGRTFHLRSGTRDFRTGVIPRPATITFFIAVLRCNAPRCSTPLSNQATIARSKQSSNCHSLGYSRLALSRRGLAAASPSGGDTATQRRGYKSKKFPGLRILFGSRMRLRAR